MEGRQLKRKRRLRALGFAAAGLVIATAFFAYFNTDPSLGTPMALWLECLTVVLCPGSLFFVTWIDIEPRTGAFVVMWVVIGIINCAVYGGIGLFVSRYLWKSDRAWAGETDGTPLN